MSNKLISGIVAGVVSLAVALFAGSFHQAPAPLTAGGTVENVPSHYITGIYAGSTDQFSVDQSGTLVEGGLVESISSGSVHLTAAQICNNSVILQAVHGAGVTASNSVTVFPTAAALRAACLGTNGMSKVVRFENVSDDAQEKATFTLNTGIDIFVASGSAVVGGKGDGPVLYREAAAIVKFTRINNTSVSADVLELINAD